MGRQSRNSPRRPGKSRRSSVFLFSLLLVVTAGVSVTTWLGFVNESQRLAARDRARVQAFYAAEAGLEMVVHYFNKHAYFDQLGAYPGTVPASYTASASPHPLPSSDFVNYEYSLFEPYVLEVLRDAASQVVRDANGHPIPLRTTYLQDMDDPSTSKIPTFSVDLSDGALVFTDSAGRERARVTQILILNPGDLVALGDDAAPAGRRIVAKVIATATAPELDGATISLESFLGESAISVLRAPGAILSQTTATFDGQFNVHWGDVWTQGDLPLMNNFQNNGNGHIPRATEDPWVRVMTNGHMTNTYTQPQNKLYANGHGDGGYTATPIVDQNDPNYYQPYAVLDGQQTNQFRNYTNLYQHQDLHFPEVDYAQLKQMVVAAGLPYYYTGPNGTIYGMDTDPRSQTYGQVVGKTYYDWFNITPPSAADAPTSDYWNPMKNFVFIDSIPVDDDGNYLIGADGKPVYNETYYPRDPEGGGVMAKIMSAGQSSHTRGAMYIANHVDFSGQGQPPAWDSIYGPDGQPYVTSPPDQDGNVEFPSDYGGRNMKVSHNGLMYVWGMIENTGNRTVYGSLHTKGGFAGSGSREVWYNYRLKDGTWINLNMSDVARSSWGIRRAALPEVDELAQAED